MNTVSETRSISLHLTEAQHRWLENARRFLEDETGCKVSESSLILRLMDCGLPAFEKEMQELRARSNSSKRRFPHLQLAYTRIEPKAPTAKK